MATAGLEVREAGRALRVQTEAPHLVSTGSGRLSTAVTLHPLPEGKAKACLSACAWPRIEKTRCLARVYRTSPIHLASRLKDELTFRWN